MAIQNINWNPYNNYAYKPVDTLSILNKEIQTTHSAWGDDSDLDSPTTKFWLSYKLTPSDRTNSIPFYRIPQLLSGSYNKIISPSISPEQFLTQSLDSAVYYLDVYSSIKIPIEISGAFSQDHIYNTHSIYADSPNLMFESTHSLTGYATFALLPKERVFTMAWGDISGSGAISASYIPYTYETKPTKAVYYTYKSILNETGSLITVGTGSVERFFAIHLDKQKLKNGIIANSVEIPLMISSSQIIFSDPNSYENNVITLTDVSSSAFKNANVGNYSYIVSGTINNKNTSDVYGTIYYDLGIILLDSDKLNSKLGLGVNLRKYPAPIEVINDHTLYYETHLNTVKLFNSLQACSYINACAPNLYMDYDCLFAPQYFKCKVKENTVENPIYIVIKAHEFNYSNSTSWQQNEVLPPSEITSSQIPTSCKDFTDLGYGCNQIENSQQKYVYWYYPNKKLPETVFAAHFIKNETGVCNCEFLGNIKEYKKTNRLPHLNYKTYSVKKSFLTEPTTYITSIGLYDDEYRLLAVAKLSKALKKNQITSYMFKINIKI